MCFMGYVQLEADEMQTRGQDKDNDSGIWKGKWTGPRENCWKKPKTRKRGGGIDDAYRKWREVYLSH
jgi:hypothetical protein